MKTILLTYVAVGIVSTFFGPLANRIKENFVDQNLASELPSTQKSSPLLSWFIHLLAIALYPIFYIGYFLNFLRESSFSKKASLNSPAYQGIYFSTMDGSGRITCGDCGFTQRLVSLMYVTKEGRDTTCRGHQCQSCGTFKEISYEDNVLTRAKSPKKAVNTATLETCGCGGTLEREKILFCPECQSQHLSYECILKTK
jgi:DNA-directed RNA polymerase subunit M/transcription elongation factor TFIIS